MRVCWSGCCCCCAGVAKSWAERGSAKNAIHHSLPDCGIALAALYLLCSYVLFSYSAQFRSSRPPTLCKQSAAIVSAPATCLHKRLPLHPPWICVAEAGFRSFYLISLSNQAVPAYSRVFTSRMHFHKTYFYFFNCNKFWNSNTNITSCALKNYKVL